MENINWSVYDEKSLKYITQKKAYKNEYLFLACEENSTNNLNHIQTSSLMSFILISSNWMSIYYTQY